MSIIFDMLIYKAIKDVKKSIIHTSRPELNRKPRTLHLEQFAMHAKKIVYYRHGEREWKLTFAYAMATVIKDSQYHITQPSPYRTRLTVMDGKIWFIDIYFTTKIAESESWKSRMQLVIHETLRNKGGVSNDLYLKFYPMRQATNPMPQIDWKALEKKPYWDDE